MLKFNTNTAVLFIVMNKPEITEKVFREIRNVQPQRLYIAIDEKLLLADGELNELSYYHIFARIDWPCSVQYFTNRSILLKEKMIGDFISLFFDREEEGIVLEDSYLPSADFWGFCSSLLEKYRNDTRIGLITGMNRQNGTIRGNGSYYFSSLTFSFGWACWRRIWKDYKKAIQSFPEFEQSTCIDKIPSYEPFKKKWIKTFRSVYYKKMELWRIHLAFDNLIHNRLSIVPNKNLIHDLRNDSLKYNSDNNVLAPGEMLEEMTAMVHPAFVIPDMDADIYTQSVLFDIPIPGTETYKPTECIFLKDKLLNLAKDSASFMKIPRIIHQIYEDLAGPPKRLCKLAESWKKKHPEWEYKFWNKHAIEDFLLSSFPEFIPYYRAFPFNVQRWDAIRYLILYKYGGLYADMDYECIDPLDTLLGDSTCCMGMEPPENAVTHHKDIIIGNALMASVPKHPYFKRIIEDMMLEKENLPEHKASVIMETTGPFMVTRIYDEYPDKSEITLLPAELVAPLTLDEVREVIRGQETEAIEDKIEKTYAIHYFFGSWVPQTKGLVDSL